MKQIFFNKKKATPFGNTYFMEKTIVGLLSLTNISNGNSINDKTENHDHNLMFEHYPFHTALSCNTINKINGLEKVRMQAGINRSPIVTSFEHGFISFNHDTSSLNDTNPNERKITTEFALIIFIKNTAEEKTKKFTVKTNGTVPVKLNAFILRPDTTEKFEVKKIIQNKISNGINNLNVTFKINNGERIALVISGRSEKGIERKIGGISIGHQNSFYFELDIKNLFDKEENGCVIDYDLTTLALTRTFENDVELWNF